MERSKWLGVPSDMTFQGSFCVRYSIDWLVMGWLFTLSCHSVRTSSIRRESNVSDKESKMKMDQAEIYSSVTVFLLSQPIQFRPPHTFFPGDFAEISPKISVCPPAWAKLSERGNNEEMKQSMAIVFRVTMTAWRENGRACNRDGVRQLGSTCAQRGTDSLVRENWLCGSVTLRDFQREKRVNWFGMNFGVEVRVRLWIHAVTYHHISANDPFFS